MPSAGSSDSTRLEFSASCSRKAWCRCRGRTAPSPSEPCTAVEATTLQINHGAHGAHGVFKKKIFSVRSVRSVVDPKTCSEDVPRKIFVLEDGIEPRFYVMGVDADGPVVQV